MVPTLLFAYGRLTPEGPETAARDGRFTDRVSGRLSDLGPYSAPIECGDRNASGVEGYVRPVGPGELTGRLDPYQGVDEGLDLRVAATTEAGCRVWVYVHARPLPPGRPRQDRDATQGAALRSRSGLSDSPRSPSPGDP